MDVCSAQNGKLTCIGSDDCLVGATGVAVSKGLGLASLSAHVAVPVDVAGVAGCMGFDKDDNPSTDGSKNYEA